MKLFAVYKFKPSGLQTNFNYFIAAYHNLIIKRNSKRNDNLFWMSGAVVSKHWLMQKNAEKIIEKVSR